VFGVQQAGVAIQDKIGGRLRGFWHVLGHLAHAPMGGQAEFATILMQIAGEQCKQRGFARTVAAHQPHFFARIERHTGFVQHHFGAASQHHIF
jgi:hypothetical protein